MISKSSGNKIPNSKPKLNSPKILNTAVSKSRSNLIVPTSSVSSINNLKHNTNVMNNINYSGLPPGLTDSLKDILTRTGTGVLEDVLSGKEKIGPSLITRLTDETKVEFVKWLDQVGNLNVEITDGGGTPAIKFKKDQNLDGINSAFRLDYSTRPIEVEISTPVVNHAYTDTYETTLNQIPTPNRELFNALHLNQCRLAFPDSETVGYTFMNKYLSPVFVSRLQRQINFGIDITKFTGTNFIKPMDTVMKALQIYLFFDSIISFTNNPLNRSFAMNELRRNISGEALTKLNSLRFILAGLPIPPNVRQYVYWFMQTYRYSELPGSALIKHCPVNILLSNANIYYCDTSDIDLVIDELNSYIPFYSLLGRACPNWITGNIDSCNEVALHDPNFTTLFANAPTYYYNDTTKQVAFPYDNQVCFASATDNLDGSIISLGATWNTTDKRFSPSVYRVNSSQWSNNFYNKWSFITNLRSLVPSYTDFTRAMCRGDVYVVNLWDNTSTTNPFGTNLAVVPPGFQPVTGINTASISSSANQFLEWLLSLDTLDKSMNDKLYSHHTTSGSKSGVKTQRKRRGK